MILNIYHNDFQYMGMSQMFTGAGDYFRPSKPHSGTLWIGFILVVVQIQEDGEATYGAWEDCEAGCPVAGSSAASTAVNIGLYIYLLCVCIHLGAASL